MNNKESSIKKRQPIVVILGHVDHGKTTLLDTIRNTNIQSREAGGITQSIGASIIQTTDGKKITFIDTPGHAAFSSMRSRGAKTADIAVLVVAANDSVKPQTKEALEYILNARIPFIVAATKMDLPAVSLGNVKADLKTEGVIFEDEGGDVPLIPVSSRAKTGIKELIDMILLVSDLNDIKGSDTEEFEARVIETNKEKMGVSVSLVVRSGVLKVGDVLICEKGEAKIRGIFDSANKPVKEVHSGEPAKILGFSEMPEVGSSIWKKSEKNMLPAEAKINPLAKRQSSDDSKLKLIIKASSAGSLEAILAGIPKDVEIVSSGIGEVIDADIFMAKSSGARIFGFEVKMPGNTSKLADTEGVKFENFNIIYHLYEKIDNILKDNEVVTTGSAMIIAEFPYEGKRVAGCKIISGEIAKKDSLTLMRDEKPLGVVQIASIRKAKAVVGSVKQGEECGIFIYPQLDFKVGDMLISRHN